MLSPQTYINKGIAAPFRIEREIAIINIHLSFPFAMAKIFRKDIFFRLGESLDMIDFIML